MSTWSPKALFYDNLMVKKRESERERTDCPYHRKIGELGKVTLLAPFGDSDKGVANVSQILPPPPWAAWMMKYLKV